MRYASIRPGALHALFVSYFALFGLIIGSTGVLWASFQQALRLSDDLFGIGQLAAPLAGTLALLVVGPLTIWFGKQRLAIVGALLLAATQIGLALVGGVWSFVTLRLLAGVGYGLLDGAINSSALDWEQATNRKLMNLLHATFSGAAVLGALVAGALLNAAWSYQLILCGLGLLALLLAAETVPVQFPQAASQQIVAQSRQATRALLARHAGVQALVVVCLLAAIAEALAGFWSVIYLRELGANLLVSGTAFALFNGAMFVGRLVNTQIVARWGVARSLGISALGIVLATALLIVPTVLAAVAAFVVLGLAVAGVIPTALSAGAQFEGVQTATIASVVMTTAFAGFVVAPPLIGWAAGQFGLQAALMITLGTGGLAMLWTIGRINAPSYQVQAAVGRAGD